MPLYGGCAEYLLNAIQTKQTEAMRQITNRRWVITGRQFVLTSELLKQCGWLSIRQLSFYTTVLSIHKTLVKEAPEHIFEKLTSGRKHRTRGTGNCLVNRTYVDEARLSIASSSYRWRGHRQHSTLPDYLKDEVDLQIFKRELKSWVKENVSI